MADRNKQDGTDARRAALKVLQGVLQSGLTLDEALAHVFADAKLRAHPSDRAFTRALATTVLRRLGQIDDLIGQLLAKPLPPRAGMTHDLLRVGAAELLFLGSAPHAAVNCAVTIADGNRKARPFKSLVNAILRRMTREGADIIARQDVAGLNLPDWLCRSWAEAYGPEAPAAIADAHLVEPPLDLTVASDPARWAKRLNGELLPTGSVRLSLPGRIEELDGFKEGAWWVQDMAAALPAKLLDAKAGDSVLDLCAAPGGKTLTLAAQGASVTAVDRSERRLARLKENLTRTKLNADIITADATTWEPVRQWDKILLDAPCSATGTARRHPDVLYAKSQDDVATLARLQAQILNRAAEWLKPGGTLIFCTCSLEALEGPAQTGLFLSQHQDFSRKPITADEIGGLAECLTADGDLRTLPHHLGDKGGMDGFYAARLVKAE